MSNIDLEKQNDEFSSASQNRTTPVHRIHTSGENDEIIHIGDTAVYKDDFIRAFGGSLNPGFAPAPIHKFANPAPLGLSAFALTTFVLSLINIQARGVNVPKIVVGLAYFYGGLVQLLAGMWEMAVENTFGATALSSYGGFWMSWAVIQTDAFGIASAYEDKHQFQNAVGFYLLGWFLFTFMMTLCTLKSTLSFFLLFFCLTVTFLLLAISDLIQNVNVAKAGGVWGVITAILGWYNAFAGVANDGNSYITIRPLYLPGSVLKPKTK